MLAFLSLGMRVHAGCWVKSVQGTVKETVYQMDPVKGLVPEAEHYCRAGDLSYIEGACVRGSAFVLWLVERLD